MIDCNRLGARMDNNENIESRVDLSVVVPIYRSQDCIPELLRQLTCRVEELGLEYEIILVDDSSPDKSWEVIRHELPNYAKAKAVRLMCNSGQVKATLCGLGKARGRLVLTMDDDLQQPPDQIRRLVEAINSNPEVDCVFGYFEEKRHARYRNIGSRLIQVIDSRSFSLPKGLRFSSFRIMRLPLAKAIVAHGTRNPSLHAIIFSCTQKISSVPVRHDPRLAGESNYTVSRQLRMAFDHICNVSMIPLRIVLFSGMFFSVCSLAVAGWYMIRYLTGKIAVPGYASQIVVMLFSSGMIMFSIGILGEYLARILKEVRSPPQYIERDYIDGFTLRR